MADVLRHGGHRDEDVIIGAHGRIVGAVNTFQDITERKHAEEAAAKLKRGQRTEDFETERLARDGRRIPVSLTVSPVKAADGRIIGASKVARDVSERRRLERERDELLEREGS